MFYCYICDIHWNIESPDDTEMFPIGYCPSCTNADLWKVVSESNGIKEYESLFNKSK